MLINKILIINGMALKKIKYYTSKQDFMGDIIQKQIIR